MGATKCGGTCTAGFLPAVLFSALWRYPCGGAPGCEGLGAGVAVLVLTPPAKGLQVGREGHWAKAAGSTRAMRLRSGFPIVLM